MREKFVYAALVLFFFGAIYLVTQGMNLINQPSDLKVASGIGLIVAVVLLFPAAMRWIWHHKTTPHGRPIVMKSPSTSQDDEPNAPTGQPKV
jgi:Na+/proline symporter